MEYIGEMFFLDQQGYTKKHLSLGTYPFITGLATEPGITKKVHRVGYMIHVHA